MKKLALIAIISTAFLSSVAHADVTASATASWDATAVKDTTSDLVVTPLKTLNFKYAEGTGAFNTQDGAFDITIQGQSGATDFELTSTLVSNTLSRTSDNSELTVGVSWNGEPLSQSTPVTLLNTANNVTSGLEALSVSSAYAGKDRVSSQGAFRFTIDSAATDGNTTDFADLADGYWSGDVKVQFTANWTV